MPRFTMTLTSSWSPFAGALLVATLVLVAASPADARLYVGKSHPSGAVTSLTTTRGDLGKCLGDLWWGLEDSIQNIVDVGKSCISEKADEFKFLVDEVQATVKRVWPEIADMAGQCVQNPWSCPRALAEVSRKELKPLASLAGRIYMFLFSLGYTVAVEMFGCWFLPGLMPAVWNTILDTIIAVECIVGK